MAAKMSCPPATQNLELNTKNRDYAFKTEWIKYGPLNVDEQVITGKITLNILAPQ